jgi:CubicO group peptidase (beta-lactamase class C family)
MKDTYFYVPDNKVERLATAYTYYADKGLNRFPDTPIEEGSFVYSADYPYHGPNKLFPGGAGLISTAADEGFGLGFGAEGVKAPLSELGSPGEYNCGGFFTTAISIDPKEQMIMIFMSQIHPNGELKLDRQVKVLAYEKLSIDRDLPNELIHFADASKISLSATQQV